MRRQGFLSQNVIDGANKVVEATSSVLFESKFDRDTIAQSIAGNFAKDLKQSLGERLDNAKARTGADILADTERALEEIADVLRAATLREVLVIQQEVNKISGEKVENANWKVSKGTGEMTHYVTDDGRKVELTDEFKTDMKERSIAAIVSFVRKKPERFAALAKSPVLPFRFRESVSNFVGLPSPSDGHKMLGLGQDSTPRQVLLRFGAHFRRKPDEFLWLTAPERTDANKPRSDVRHLMCVASAWARAGFPAIQPSHRLAAAMMATWIPPECATDFRSPWPVVVFAIPDGLGLSVDERPLSLVALILPSLADDEVNETKDSTHFVLFFPERPMADENTHRAVVYSATFGSLDAIARGSSACQSFVEDFPPLEAQEDVDFARHCVSRKDSPSIDLVCRLVVNCLIELNESPAHRARIEEGPPRSSASSRPNKVATGRGRGRGDVEPIAWVFAVTRDVRHDLRDWVRAYATEGGSAGRSPRVQCLVRGHRRRQVCGRGRSERKTIWIEPFWRGGEDLPIAVRQHVLDRARTRDRAERMESSGNEGSSETSETNEGETT